MDVRLNLFENQLVIRVAKHMVAMDRIISESTCRPRLSSPITR